MAESLSVGLSESNTDTMNTEYRGPDKCEEKIATPEDEVITVPSDDSDGPTATQVDFLKACARCHKNFTETKQQPKLLPCLHSLCEDCLIPNKDEEDVTVLGETAPTHCPHCSLVYDAQGVLENLFIQELLLKDVKLEEATDGEPTTHECTACEEKEVGTSFCVDCAEWLCEQCVTAHRRVRVTKDHKIVPKEEAPTSDTSKPTECFLYCKQHKQEKLMFFCERCDILTCRDCQLVEHKDHRYQFLEVAASNYKLTLQDHMNHMHDRSKKLNQVHALIENKLGQVKQQHAGIVKQVQDQADSLIKQIIQSARQLLQNVKVACETMARKLSKESHDLTKILGKYDHCINFVEDVMKDGSNMALLLSKSAVLKECGRIFNIPIEAHSVKNQFVVQYKHDNQFIHSNLHRFGAIFVNSQRYHPQDKNYNATHVNPPLASHPPSYNAPPSYSSPSQMLIQTDDQKKRQLLMALKQASNPMSNPQMQSLLSQKMSQHQQQQHQQHQANAIPQSVSNLVSQMRMNVPQSNGWQAQQQMLRSNAQAVNLQRSAYASAQQQPFQPMRLQHRPATVQSVYSNSHQTTLTQPVVSAPKMPVQQQPQAARGPPPLIRSPNQSSTPPSNNSRPSSAGSTGSSGRQMNTDPSGLPSGVRVKQERRSSCENDCVITAAKVKGEKSSVPACSGASPKPTQEVNPASTVGGTWASSTHGGTSTSTHAAETEKNLEKVIEDLPMEDLPTFDDIDTTLLTAGSINKQLSVATELSRRPAQSPGKNGATTMFPDMSYSDPNEDYCACCHNGGEVLCCDSCPRVFHLQCHIPPLNAVPNGVFVCTLCSTGDNIRINSPVPEDAMNNGKRKAPGGLSDKEIKVCERMMLELFCHSTSVAFHEPVSKQVPNYYKIIQTPMDFTTIKCKLSRQHFNHYNCVEDFLADVKLVFQNCATYNQESSEVGKAGKTVRIFFEELVAKYLPHYVTFASKYPPRPQTFVESDGATEPKRQKTDDPVLHIA